MLDVTVVAPEIAMLERVADRLVVAKTTPLTTNSRTPAIVIPPFKSAPSSSKWSVSILTWIVQFAVLLYPLPELKVAALMAEVLTFGVVASLKLPLKDKAEDELPFDMLAVVVATLPLGLFRDKDAAVNLLPPATKISDEVVNLGIISAVNEPVDNVIFCASGVESISIAPSTSLILLPSIIQPEVLDIPKKPVLASIPPLKLPDVAVTTPSFVTEKFGELIDKPSTSPLIKLPVAAKLNSPLAERNIPEPVIFGILLVPVLLSENKVSDIILILPIFPLVAVICPCIMVSPSGCK